jgi:hypothetical protein
MPAKALTSPESQLTAPENTLIPSLKIYRLQSIWHQEEARQKKQPRNKVNIGNPIPK